MAKGKALIKHIRFFNIKKLIPLFLLSLFLIFIWIYYPFEDIFFPKEIKTSNDIISSYDNEDLYIEIASPTLYYTGYDYVKYGFINGSFYYTFIDDSCVIFLLDKDTSDPQVWTLSDRTIYGKLEKGTSAYKDLLKNLSEDLNWTYKGLKSTTLPIVINEAGYYKTGNFLLFSLLCVLSLVIFLNILKIIINIKLPETSLSCRYLKKDRFCKSLLIDADEEFSNQKVLSTKTMVITSNYLIILSRFTTAVIPLDKIIWIYKYSILSRFLWIQTKITYSLRIITLHGFVDCPWQSKEDVDVVISYLQNKYPQLLVGFSPENKKKAKLIKKEETKHL